MYWGGNITIVENATYLKEIGFKEYIFKRVPSTSYVLYLSKCAPTQGIVDTNLSHGTSDCSVASANQALSDVTALILHCI